MRRIIGLLIFLLIAVFAKGQKYYRLVWSDEFEAEGRPSKDWTFERGFVRNRELQWYQSQNAYVKDGCLVIEGRREHRKNPLYEAGSNDWRRNREFIEYTSSSLTTRLGFQFLYGRVEVRAKIPVSSGSWPAIWLWATNGSGRRMERST